MRLATYQLQRLHCIGIIDFEDSIFVGSVCGIDPVGQPPNRRILDLFAGVAIPLHRDFVFTELSKIGTSQRIQRLHSPTKRDWNLPELLQIHLFVDDWLGHFAIGEHTKQHHKPDHKTDGCLVVGSVLANRKVSGAANWIVNGPGSRNRAALQRTGAGHSLDESQEDSQEVQQQTNTDHGTADVRNHPARVFHDLQNRILATGPGIRIVPRLVERLVVVTQRIVHRDVFLVVDIVIRIDDSKAGRIGLGRIGTGVVGSGRRIQPNRIGFVDMLESKCDLPFFAVNCNAIQVQAVVLVKTLRQQVGSQLFARSLFGQLHIRRRLVDFAGSHSGTRRLGNLFGRHKFSQAFCTRDVFPDPFNASDL